MNERRKDYMDLDKLYDSIDEIKERLTRIEAHTVHFSNCLDEHKKIISGNGHKGCMERIGLIESSTHWLWLFFGTAVATITTAMTIMWGHIK